LVLILGMEMLLDGAWPLVSDWSGGSPEGCAFRPARIGARPFLAGRTGDCTGSV